MQQYRWVIIRHKLVTAWTQNGSLTEMAEVQVISGVVDEWGPPPWIPRPRKSII